MSDLIEKTNQHIAAYALILMGGLVAGIWYASIELLLVVLLLEVFNLFVFYVRIS